MAAIGWLFILFWALGVLRVSGWLCATGPMWSTGQEASVAKVTSSYRWTALVILTVFVVSSLLILSYVWLSDVGGLSIFSGIVALMAIVGFVALLSRKPQLAWVGGIYGVFAFGAWLLWPNWLTSDLLAVVLVVSALASFAQFTLNFTFWAIICGGVFVYDIIMVFVSGLIVDAANNILTGDRLPPMMVVAPERLALDSPYGTALGLGDIFFPGLMVMVAAVLAYRYGKMAVLHTALGGYAVGLFVALMVNYFTGVAQPALLYLFPAVLAAILIGARRAGLKSELLALRR